MPFFTRTRPVIANRWGGSAVHSIAAATSVATGVLFRLFHRGERLSDRSVDVKQRVEVGDAEKRRNAVPGVHEREIAILRLEAVERPDEDSQRRRVHVLEIRHVQDDGTDLFLRDPFQAALELADGLADFHDSGEPENGGASRLLGVDEHAYSRGSGARHGFPRRTRRAQLATVSEPDRTSPSKRTIAPNFAASFTSIMRLSPACGVRRISKLSMPARKPRRPVSGSPPSSRSAAWAIASTRRTGLPHSPSIEARAPALIRAETLPSRKSSPAGERTASTNRNGYA